MLNLVLCMIRTINIVAPFVRTSRNAVAIWIALYLIFCTGFSNYQLHSYLSTEYSFSNFVLYYFYQSMGHTHSLFGKGFSYCRSSGLLIGLMFVLPAGICIICMIIQIFILDIGKRTIMRRRVGRKNNLLSLKHRMTVTITMITLLFCVCSVGPLILTGWYCSWFGVVGLKSITGEGLDFHSLMKLEYVCSVLFPFINAAFSPVILIHRGSRLRRHMRSSILYTKRMFRSGS